MTFIYIAETSRCRLLLLELSAYEIKKKTIKHLPKLLAKNSAPSFFLQKTITSSVNQIQY